MWHRLFGSIGQFRKNFDGVIYLYKRRQKLNAFMPRHDDSDLCSQHCRWERQNSDEFNNPFFPLDTATHRSSGCAKSVVVFADSGCLFCFIVLILIISFNPFDNKTKWINNFEKKWIPTNYRFWFLPRLFIFSYPHIPIGRNQKEKKYLCDEVKSKIVFFSSLVLLVRRVEREHEGRWE